MRIIKYKGSFIVVKKFKSWIYIFARILFIENYPAKKNKRPVMMDVEKVRDSIPETDEEVQQLEREKLLQRSMNMLTDEQRELLVLTRFQRMKYEEVALIMDTTVANIKVKVHRAILKLKDHYFELERN
jgi:RNA polymerase sigma-70 factor (ECF subfamily)